MQPKGLIFDCDGTIVDTMPIHYAAWCATTVKHGLEFPEDRFYALGGVSPFEVLRMLPEEQGVEIDAEAVPDVFAADAVDQVHFTCSVYRELNYVLINALCDLTATS